MSLNDIRFYYFIILLIFFFFLDFFLLFFIFLNLMESYRIDRESNLDRIWETMDGGIMKKIKKPNNAIINNISVDNEENDYLEQDVDSYLEEDVTNSEDYLWYNCNFRFEQYYGYTIVSGEDHMILKDKLTGIYKYLIKRRKYEDDFLLYHASNFLQRKYHRKKFYEEVTVFKLDMAKDASNIKFFNKYKFLEFNKKFNYKKN